MGRLGLAFRCFFRVLGGKPVPDEVLPQASSPALPPPPESKAESTYAIQLLALLQKEGRLLDFLQEELEGYDDAQVGAAVRPIHRDCQRVLAEHIQLKPVVDGEEDGGIEVPSGFDPSEIRLIGNVTGEPPFQGVLRHHGWRAATVGLPAPAKGTNPMIIAPAEVELA